MRERFACPRCNGSGVDPEPATEVRCCENPSAVTGCCGAPEPVPVQKDCTECDGGGTITW